MRRKSFSHSRGGSLVVNLILTTSVVSFCHSHSEAQRVEISPVPQSVEWGGKAFDVAAIARGDVHFAEGVKGDSALKMVEHLIPERKEGYYLKITPDSVILAGADETGLFYARQTFGKITDVREVQEVEIIDYPFTERRGVIEGFYGNPWSFDDRVAQFEFYGKNKLNTYVYGPKDDPYHHSRWYEPYPEKEGENIRQLVEAAAAGKVKFIWAMHPGNSIVSEDDRRKALEKLEQMYSLGVRSFAIFFDDIDAESVADQISYLNFLTEEFVDKKGDVAPLAVCPTQYNKAWANGSYLRDMGEGLKDGINMMWTGNSVVDMIEAPDCEWFTAQTGRKPFIWLNYPVNDYGNHNLLLGPFTGNGEDVYDKVSAFCANPMQYAEASKVALYSMADYLWNPVAYDAAAAWERSMEAIMPGHSAAFRQFCIDNVDVAENKHNFRLMDESPEFKALMDKYDSLSKKSSDAYAAYFRKMEDAAKELLLFRGNPLVDEIREFVEYYQLQAQRGLLLTQMAKEKNKKKRKALLKQYDALTEDADLLVSRDYKGSIQPVKAHTATLYIEPFLQRESQRMR